MASTSGRHPRTLDGRLQELCPLSIPEISLSPDAQANTLLSSYRNPSGRIYVLLSSHGSVCNAGMLVRRLAADVPKVKWFAGLTLYRTLLLQCLGYMLGCSEKKYLDMLAYLNLCCWLQESVSRSGKWSQLPGDC